MSASFVKNIIIIILLIHFKRITLHMPVVIFRNANIYNIRRRIHQLITWPVTWPLVFDFIQRIIALLEREGKMLPVNHTFRRLVKATGKTVRTWQYIYKKVHIVMKIKLLPYYSFTKYVWYLPRLPYNTRSTLLAFHRTTTCKKFFILILATIYPF